MTKALVIDTSTDAVAIAVGTSNSDSVFRSMQQHAFHSENILVAINEVLNEAQSDINDIDVIGVGIGPGMFTGLRVGVTCAHSIAHALGIKIVYLSSLEIAALASVKEDDNVVIAKDARRNELYAAHYEFDYQIKSTVVDSISFVSYAARLKNEHLISPEGFIANAVGNQVVIDSLTTYPVLQELQDTCKMIPFNMDVSKSIDLALDAHSQGMHTDIFVPSILYLRKSDAELSWGK